MATGHRPLDFWPAEAVPTSRPTHPRTILIGPVDLEGAWVEKYVNFKKH